MGCATQPRTLLQKLASEATGFVSLLNMLDGSTITGKSARAIEARCLRMATQARALLRTLDTKAASTIVVSVRDMSELRHRKPEAIDHTGRRARSRSEHG
jgi:hypothetical protein